MQVTNGEELLKKYDLKSNDAILAEEKHAPMCVVSAPSWVCMSSRMLSNYSYGELVEKHEVTYVAGGASQNSARGAAVSP